MKLFLLEDETVYFLLTRNNLIDHNSNYISTQILHYLMWNPHMHNILTINGKKKKKIEKEKFKQ